MIAADRGSAEATLLAFEHIAGSVPDDLRPLLDAALDASFPGGILPVPSMGSTTFYGVAQDEGSWRLLAPMLLAFAGPTMTDFRGLTAELDGCDAVESWLSGAGFHAVARLRTTVDTATATGRALLRLVATHHRARRGRLLGQSTGALLRGFHAALAVPDVPAARTVLDRLKAESRIDALNLAFLEIALLGSGAEWTAILTMPSLSHILAARRPPAISGVVAEACWQVHLASVAEAGAPELIMDAYRTRVRPLGAVFRNLPRNATPGALAAASVAVAYGDLPNAEFLDLLGEGGIARLLPSVACLIQSAAPEEASPPASPPSAARAALTESAVKDSLDAYQRAVAAVEQLSEDELARVLAHPTFRGALAGARRAVGPDRPENWAEWVFALPRPEFVEAARFAERAAASWRLEETLKDPADVGRLREALDGLPEGLATERLLMGLPHLVTWLRGGETFPVTLHGGLYLSLLTVVAFRSSIGEDLLGLGGVLLDAALGCGLDRVAYGDAIDLAAELASRANGRRSAEWLLDTLGATLLHPVADPARRQQFAFQVADVLRPHLARLPERQVRLFRILARDLGLPDVLPPPSPGEAEVPVASLASLGEQVVGIYTLTESAGRQARSALQELAPQLRVVLNHDHVGTERLKAMAQSVDLLVMVTQSATHAATTFIQRHRSGRPLLFSRGRGVSTLLASIEEWIEENGREQS